MRNLIVLSSFAAMCCTQAQQIDAYRYWYDDAIANAVTTTVTSADELVLNAAWPTAGLTPGFHRVSVQVRDTNGDWSVPQTQHFTRGNQAITGYRYWVNDNAGNITTGAIGPNTEVTLNALIDPGTLPNDYNTVTLQFRDADAEWSVPVTATFVKNTGEVNGYEYWIDDDIANSFTGTIGPGNVVDLIDDLPTGTTSGVHLFTIRFSGTNGTWSVPLTAEFSFFTAVAELPGISDLLLFPNPVNDRLTLRLRTDGPRKLDLTVIDASGRPVGDLISWAASGPATRTFDLAGLAAGAYGLRIVDGEGSTTLRFVKN